MTKLVFLFMCILLISCKSSDSTNEFRSSKDYDELMKGDYPIIVDGRELNAEVYAWRDLMPSVDETSKGIFISIKLTAKDGNDLPLNLRANKIWVFDKKTIWETEASLTPSSDSKLMEMYSRNGPSWEPEKLVNVSFDLTFSGKKYMFLLKDQKINAVY